MRKRSFVGRYIFSTDHKVIGIQYGLTALCFLLVGFLLVMIMRWQLAFPGRPLPFVNLILGETAFPGGVMSPEFYNQLGAMHGTIMIFLGIVPLAVGAFGNYLLPLQVGATDMAFPRLNGASYWAYFVGGVIMLASFFLPGGAAQAGWTSYPPLASITPGGQTAWLVGMLFLILSSLLGSINFLVTGLHLKVPGLPFFKLPIFVWAQLVTSVLLLLAFPPLEVAAVLQLMDRTLGTNFFMPTGLVVGGEPLTGAGGGSPVLWQHLFWFLAHPEVYVLILPAVGIVAEILVTNTRKPLYGYRTLVYAMLFLGVMSFLVWAHHMFLTGMGTTISTFFQATTLIISIPSIVILTTFVLTLWGASIRFNVPMLFAIAFLPMFGLGGLTGLPLGLAAADIHLHDTYYVIGHFHYIVAPGTLFALFAGVYHWYPKLSGRLMSERLGKIHFWGSFLFMNGIFLPMFLVGMAGVSRRMYDLSLYAHAKAVFPFNVVMSTSAWALALFQIPFIFNVLTSWRRGKIASANPWACETLEWRESLEHGEGEIPFAREAHPATRLTNGEFGMWLFLASEVMFFAGLFSAYLLLRIGTPDWPSADGRLEATLALVNTALLATAGVLLYLARKNVTVSFARYRVFSSLSIAFCAAFLVVKGIEYQRDFSRQGYPWTDNFWGMYYALTGAHLLHVVGALLAGLYFLAWSWSPEKIDRRQLAVRLKSLVLYWGFLEAIWFVMMLGVYLI